MGWPGVNAKGLHDVDLFSGVHAGASPTHGPPEGPGARARPRAPDVDAGAARVLHQRGVRRGLDELLVHFVEFLPPAARDKHLYRDSRRNRGSGSERVSEHSIGVYGDRYRAR